MGVFQPADFTIAVPDRDIVDLRHRLTATRRPRAWRRRAAISASARVARLSPAALMACRAVPSPEPASQTFESCGGAGISVSPQ